MAVFFALAIQKISQSLQSLLGVDHTGGIVGGVDDDAHGVFGDGFFYGIQLDLETGHIRGNDLELSACSLHERLVLGKIGAMARISAPGTARALKTAVSSGAAPQPINRSPGCTPASYRALRSSAMACRVARSPTAEV